MSTTIRVATAADLPTIRAIYGQSVRETVATFDTDDPPTTYWQAKLDSAAPGDHLIAVEHGGSMVGFAFSGPFRPRPAYLRTRETSIYLADTAVGQGLGRLTYTHLLDLLRADGIHTVLAVVAEPNPASCALHEALGFEVVGTLREVGWKFGHWVDTRWYQLILSS